MKPVILTTEPEQRQIANVLEFPAVSAPYLDWNKIAAKARELGCYFEARHTIHGACTVTLFWNYTDED